MDQEAKIKNLIQEKNKHAERLKELENKKNLTLDKIQIGNFIIIGSGEHEGIWRKKPDGNWYRIEV